MKDLATDRSAPMVVDDLATLRAVAEPLRFRLLELLDRPRTVKELARAVDRPPDRLYYHLRVLHRHGLVDVADERVVNGIVERRFQAAADQIHIAADLAVPAATRGQLVGSVLGRLRHDYEEAMRRAEPGEGRVRLAVQQVRLSDERRAELEKRLAELLDDLDDGDEGNDVYAVVTGYYLVPGPADDDDDDDDHDR